MTSTNSTNHVADEAINNVLLVPLSRFHAAQVKNVFANSRPSLGHLHKLIQSNPADDLDAEFKLLFTRALEDDISYVALNWKINTVCAACIGLRPRCSEHEEGASDRSSSNSSGVGNNENSLANSGRRSSFLRRIMPSRGMRRSATAVPQQRTVISVLVLFGGDDGGAKTADAIRQKLVQQVSEAARKRINGNFALQVFGCTGTTCTNRVLQNKMDFVLQKQWRQKKFRKPFACLAHEDDKFRERIQTM